jgi:hypothetical protein
MRKFTLLLTVLLAFSAASMAQFRFGSTSNTNKTIGQSLVVDSLNGAPTGVSHFTVNFNSNLGNSFYNATAVTFKKCQTQKGLQVNTYPNATSTTAIKAGDFKCESYGGSGNPVHVASTDSLISIMKKYTELNVASTDTNVSLKNLYWKPAACLFDVVKGDTTNLAFGCYPGKFKRVEYGFEFDFSGFGLSSDLSFTIDTYDPGNTGKTAIYKLIVFLGSVSAANAVDTIENFYVTGSGKKEVKLAEALGLNYSVFSTKKVFIMINTLGTNSEITEGTYDPIIIFDNFNVSWGTPSWVSPVVTSGQIYNESGAGNYSPATINQAGTQAKVQLYLKDKGRVSTISLINDVESPPSRYQFLDSLGVFANDGTGKYTIPVSYKFTPSVLNEETYSYSDSYITIPAPASSTADDLMILMKYTPNANSELTERVEINNGIRFWWDVQSHKGSELPIEVVSIEKTGLDGMTVYVSDNKLYVKGAESSVSIYNLMGQKIGTYTAFEAEKGISTQKGILIIKASKGAVKVIVP